MTSKSIDIYKRTATTCLQYPDCPALHEQIQFLCSTGVPLDPNFNFTSCGEDFIAEVCRQSAKMTFQSALQDIVLLVAIPLMSKLFGWRDTIIIMIGAAAHTTARLFYIVADDSLIFYIGGVFASFGPIVAPVIRSMVSKIVLTSEKGKAFSVLAVADNAIPLVSGICYSSLYYSTLNSYHSALFYLTMGTQIGVFLLIMYIHLKTDKEEFDRDIREMDDISPDENDRFN